MRGSTMTREDTAAERSMQSTFRRSHVVSCAEHGPSAWCYVQDDGSHVDSDRCRCFLIHDPSCPVDAHREATVRATRLMARRPR